MDCTKINHKIGSLDFKRDAPLKKYNDQDMMAMAAYFWTEFNHSYN